MSKLESLVPPLELCRLIPQGKFADSALVWVTCCDIEPNYKVVDKRKFPYIPEEGALVRPAPTLAEILWEMASYPNRFRMVTVEVDNPEETTVVADFQNFHLNGKPGGVLHEAKDENGATAALKLWLEMEAKNE